ncbi:hypothetical protein HPB48_009943 [Haemaphysalis longicornis]|uniref:Uncharacterized protein n=1 Tax=Haemaphysalis longicornis TaxID=44386 RepID=A0A9J6GBI0_HAELO|nr:hypothetical protein HPB48_009943 [Haemaphysalis longicornis]
MSLLTRLRATSLTALPLDAPATYNEVTKFFYMSRKVFAAPHPKLNRAQAVSLRLLQTGTYPCLAVLHEVYPDVYRDERLPVLRTDLYSLAHMLWECGPALDKQILAVRWARDRIGGLDLPVPTWD